LEKLRGGRQLLATLPLENEIINQLKSTSVKTKDGAISTSPRKLDLQEPLLISLPESELEHAIKVLRIRPGEKLKILDTKKQILALGILVEDHSKKELYSIEINSLEMHESPAHHILIGLPEQKTAEEITEILTSIGTKSIYFFIGDKTQIKNLNKEKVLSRLIKKRDSSLKQSFATFAPEVKIIDSLLDALEQFKTEEIKKTTLISSNDNDFINKHNINILNIKSTSNSYCLSTLLILGTEGGFSEKELILLKNNKSSFMSLGKNVLRVETAASLALACFNCFKESNTS